MHIVLRNHLSDFIHTIVLKHSIMLHIVWAYSWYYGKVVQHYFIQIISGSGISEQGNLYKRIQVAMVVVSLNMLSLCRVDTRCEVCMILC